MTAPHTTPTPGLRAGDHQRSAAEDSGRKNTKSRPTRPFHLIATVASVALAALVVPAVASANNGKVGGIRADVNRGTLDVKGGDQSNAVALRLNAGDPNTIEVDVGDDGAADFSFARGEVDAIKVKLGDARDSARIDDANGAFTDSIPTTIAGGDGNDSLEGGQQKVAAENETFSGGDGNDLVDGGKGNDTAFLGGGNDTFRWDNGEGSDVIEGQDGTDTMVFNGNPAAAQPENVRMTATPGGRLTFFRVQGNVTMDTDGVETVDFNALGGPDSIEVNDLTGTDVAQTNVDLAATLGASAGDGVLDNVVVNGTNGDDNINITGNGSGADVTGLATAVSVKHADSTASLSDTLSVNTRAGTDHVATTGVAGLIQVLVNGMAA